MVSGRPSFIVRTRYKTRNRGLLGRSYFHWSKWHTVHAAKTQEEAFSVVTQLVNDPACIFDDVLVSHHGRRVNDKVNFAQPVISQVAKTVTQVSCTLTTSSVE